MAAETLVWKGYDWAEATGSTDGDWAHLNNWQQDSGAAAGHYPGAGADVDTVIFDRRSGSYSVTLNLDQSAATAALAAMKVLEGWTGSIGDEDNPLLLKDDSDNGTLTYSRDGSGGQDYIFARFTTVNIISTTRATAAGDPLTLLFDTTAPTTVEVLGGTVVFDDSLFGLTSAGIVTLKVKSRSAGDSPTVTLRCAVTTLLEIMGGKTIWEAGTLTAARVYGGDLRSETLEAKTLTAGYGYGGAIDLREGNVTIGATGILMAGATVNLPIGSTWKTV